MNQATGVVISVPSDVSDIWATLRDLQKKPDFYQIKPEWAQYQPIPIIDVPKYDDLAALTICDQFQIKSLKDKDLFVKAKEEVDKLGFYEGKMLIGKYREMKVCEAKPLVRKDMIDSGDALPYFEPENTVISRNNDQCVVSYCISHMIIKNGRISEQVSISQIRLLRNLLFYQMPVEFNRIQFR